ncbi:MAG: hypothetical protein IJL90_04025 [Lachnospiraceae bacterium]|nr:hypothetical protein [Lachnospiraceae bacterium]
MEYMEFLECVKDHINEASSDIVVSVHSAVKNNGVKMSGLSFSRKGYNASPTIYMENYYSDYCNGSDISEIADRIVTVYRENNMSVKLDMSFFEDFGLVKKKLFIKLINKKKNTGFLEDAPYEDFLDLAMVAYVRISDKKIGNGVIMVRNEHLRLWNVDAGTVLAAAKKNTHDHDGYNLRHILDVVGSALPPSVSNDPVNDFPMYVATNRKMTNGAAVLTLKDKLKEFGKTIGCDYYVIPSSVHEVILIAKCDDMTDSIDEMIRDVNSTSLGPDDVLSDHVYMYSLKDEVLIF